VQLIALSLSVFVSLKRRKDHYVLEILFFISLSHTFSDTVRATFSKLFYMLY